MESTWRRETFFSYIWTNNTKINLQMKKITLAMIGVAGFFGSVLAQPIITPTVPTVNSSTQVRLPNGLPEHKSLKGVMLLRQSDLLSLTATNITGAGFMLLDGTDPVTSVGTMSFYVQNTADVTNNKSALGWTGAITGMTLAGNGSFNVNTLAQTSVVPVCPSANFTAFTYTGAGLYVAWHWEEATPSPNTNTYAATWAANNAGTGNGLCSTSNASTALGAANTMTVTDFRPVVVFTGSNTATNELSVESMYSPGKVAKLSGAQVPITAVIKNGSIGTLTGITVGVTVSGANTFIGTSSIPTLAPGATISVSFTGYTPTTNGNNTITVSVAPDQVMANNAASQLQNVNCNEVAIHPDITAGTYTSSAYGAGSNAAGLIYSFRYTAPVACNATGVRVVVPGFSNAANAGKQIYAVVMDNTGAIVGQGNPITIGAANLDQFSTLSFTAPAPLTSGQDYNFGIAIPANGYFPIGNTAFTGPAIAGYFSSPITGGAFTAISVGHLSVEGVLNFPATNITATPSKTLVCKGSPQQLTLTATGADSYTWSAAGLGNGGTAVYTPSAAGNATLAQVTVVGSFTSGAALGCKSNTVSMLFALSACVGVAENTGAAAIKVMPNPAVAGKTTISNLNGVNTINVFNALGQVVITRVSTNETESIDLSNFPSGNYLIRITDNSNETRTVKLVNQN
jgi:hypothetical protein